MVLIQAPHYGFSGLRCLSTQGLLVARLLGARCPSPSWTAQRGPDHPRHSPREAGSAEPKKRGFALSDSHRIPSQRSRASLKRQAETIRQIQRLSCCWPFCYSALLFSVSSSPTWSAGINLDVVHGAPKYHAYRTSLRSQCLGGTNENKIQPADVGSEREDRNIPMAVPIWRVEAQNDLFNISDSVQTRSLLLLLLLQESLGSRWN